MTIPLVFSGEKLASSFDMCYIKCHILFNLTTKDFLVLFILFVCSLWTNEALNIYYGACDALTMSFCPISFIFIEYFCLFVCFKSKRR